MDAVVEEASVLNEHDRALKTLWDLAKAPATNFAQDLIVRRFH